MRAFFLVLLITSSSQLYAELYKWVDEKGDTHFSDKALSDKAEPYTPPPILTVPAGPAADFKPKADDKDTPIKYESISVTSPENDAVFFPDTTSVGIVVKVLPRIDTKEGHKVAIYLNGEIVSQGTLGYSANDLPRGSYTISATILNSAGTPVITSPPVTFHIKRHHR